MSKHLLSNPKDAVFWRSCAIGASWPMALYLTNTGDATLTIASIAFTTGTRFDASYQFTTIAPGANALMLLYFTPQAGDEGTLLSDTLTITHDGDNSPFTVAFSGYAMANTGAHIYMSPSAWTFDWVNSRSFVNGITIGEVSNIAHIQLVNSGPDLLTIDAISAFWPYSLVDPKPVLPAVLASQASLLLNLRVYPTVAGFAAADAFEVVSNASAQIEVFVAAFTGLALTSANNLTGATRGALASFAAATIKKFNPTNFDTETVARLIKTFDMGMPANEKLLARLRARYEDLGVAAFATTIRTKDESQSFTSAIGSVTADEFLYTELIDLLMTEEVFKLTLSRQSGDGPLSLVDLGLEIDQKGPSYG